MIKQLIFFSVLGFLSVGCKSDRSGLKNGGRNNEIRYAKSFQVIEKKGYVEVKISNPTSNKTATYILANHRLKSIPLGAIFIQTPIKSLIALSSTHIGMLSTLHALDKVAGVSSRRYIYNPLVKRNIDLGKIEDFGDESMISFEKIVASNSTLLMYSGFQSSFPHELQLKHAGIVCMPNFDWKENHPLGKAEWLLLFGYLTGKEAAAKSYFASVVASYDSLTKLAKSTRKAPTLFSGNLMGDNWYAPAGESFNAQFFHDAHGAYTYRFTKGVGSLELSFESVLTKNRDADYWFNPGVSSMKEILSVHPKMGYFSSVTKKKVYCYSHNMNRFWEMSAVEPHYVLADLIQLLHPELNLKTPLHFYKRLN